jgi:hypothetical protein
MVSATQMRRRTGEVEQVRLAAVARDQVLDHLPVAGGGEDASRTTWWPCSSASPGGLADQRGCQPAALVEFLQQDAA